MDILHLVPDFRSGVGGIKVFNNFFAKALLDLGHDLRIISLNDEPKVERPSPSSISPHSSTTSSSNKSKFRKPEFVAAAFAEVIRSKPDLIICGHIHFAPLCRQISKLSGVPYGVILYGVDAAQINPSRFAALKKAAAIIAISSSTKNAIETLLPEKIQNRITILPCTFDDNTFKPGSRLQSLKQKLGINDQDPVMLTVGRLSANEKYKGYDRVIEILVSIRKEFPSIKYILAGAGDDQQRIRDLIQNLKLDNNVLLPGYVSDSDLPDYYRLCDLFIMPSKGEGFGIVYLEALATGKPVIGSMTGGAADALRNGELGILVDPESQESIANAILTVLRKDVDPKILDSSFLRNSAIEHFGYARFVSSISKILVGLSNKVA